MIDAVRVDVVRIGMRNQLLLASALAACSYPSYTTEIIGLCDDAHVDVAGHVDSPPAPPDAPDAPADAPACNPTPGASFPDVTGQGHVTFSMRFPTDYASSCATPRPLVMFLDGFGGDGPSSIARFQMTGYENEGGGALVLAPTGLISTTTHYARWNVGPVCCESVQPANDDVAYLGGLIDQAIARGWNVDRARIYVLGMSNGGVMAARLACERADVVTGVVEISSVAYAAACTSSRPVHRAIAHGWPDTTIRYVGGGPMSLPILGGGTVTMPSAYVPVEGPGGTVDQAAHANGCTGTLATHPASYSYGTRTVNFDDHPGYPSGVADTIVVPISGCPADGSVTFYQGPYLSPTWNHSVVTGADFGVWIRGWLASHSR